MLLGFSPIPCRALVLSLPFCAIATAQQTHSITSIFRPLATPADRVYELSMLVLIVCAVIFAVVASLAIYAIIRYRRRAENETEPAQVYGSNQIEIAWTVVPILIVVVLTMATARITSAVQDRRLPADALKVTVIAHQYWWEFQYPDLGFTTANELHVPAGSARQPRYTSLTLKTADVVHSFWVPELAGKTDILPAQTNTMWIDPRQPGTYLGNCAQYCGTQHANMLLRVVVDSPADFERWVAEQKQPAAAAANPAGPLAFLTSTCTACHTIRGTPAQGTLGPDLTHLMSRKTLAAREMANTRENLRAWIQDPQRVKPGNKMPVMPLTPQQLDRLTEYLATLN